MLYFIQIINQKNQTSVFRDDFLLTNLQYRKRSPKSLSIQKNAVQNSCKIKTAPCVREFTKGNEMHQGLAVWWWYCGTGLCFCRSEGQFEDGKKTGYKYKTHIQKP